MSCLLGQLSVDKSTELNENVGELINLTSWGRLTHAHPRTRLLCDGCPPLGWVGWILEARAPKDTSLAADWATLVK